MSEPPPAPPRGDDREIDEIDTRATKPRLGAVRLSLVALGGVLLVAIFGFRLSPRVALLFDIALALAAALLVVVASVEWKKAAGKRGARTIVGGRLILSIATAIGAVLLALVFSEAFLVRATGAADRWGALFFWIRLQAALWIALEALALRSAISTKRWNPAATFVGSFAALILIGSLLLMLPQSSRVGSASPSTAAFTATSAVCVTGLTVVDTGSYWSRSGQIVILLLIQMGGLGMMTFSASLGVFFGQDMNVGESRALGVLFEQRALYRIRRLVFVIVAFTVLMEAFGAVLLSGLWPDLPRGERIFYCVFHSVSAFCNAGFALTADSLAPYSSRWQVWGAISGLIFFGGLGFAAIEDISETSIHRLRRIGGVGRHADRRPRLRLSTRLALLATAFLLTLGVAGALLFDGTGAFADKPLAGKLREAWFLSVTSRTAGFATVPLEEFSNATRFLVVILMFVGASPGSTGGGIKTTVMATTTLALATILRGRSEVEVFHRTIPDEQVRRALLIGALGTAIVAVVTIALTSIEDPALSFLDYLFEATSAFATVGLSTGATPRLSETGRILIAATMFVGRVGPLTLMAALASRAAPKRYRYPDERILLG